jgi:UDP-glucose 4-epimerase
MPRRFLITGGAGYIGSHLVVALREHDEDVVVLDNLRQGHRAAVPGHVRLVVADLADTATVDALLAECQFHAVFHFASLALVGDSMRTPFHYMLENAANGIRLIDACVRHGIHRFVLSSTANVYGQTDRPAIDEASRIDPASPYGDSKWMLERALYWADKIHGLRYACLRYFNAAGADPLGRLGEDHSPETHLIPLAIDAALGRRDGLEVNGNDYQTPDGTCIRDYVHVSDLASAHLLALARLESASVTYNLGNGSGHSVLQVIQAVEQVTGRPVPHRIGPRRRGDPPVLIASSEQFRRDTGWQPQFPDLHDIIRTAAAWREAHPNGYGSDPMDGTPNREWARGARSPGADART